MKVSMPKLFSVALIFVLIVSFLPAQPARAAISIIAQWNFESPNPADATGAIYPNPIAPAVGTGNASGVHTSASTAWSTPAGNGSTDSFSSNNWTVGDYYQFSTNTAGFTGISLAWDQTGSGTGPRDFKLAYSTDGTTFTDFYSYSLPSPAVSWSSGSTSLTTKFSSDLSSAMGLNNQTNVYFRLIDTSTTSISGSTVGTGGTGRVDNFTVSGTAIPAAPSVDLSVSTINASEAAATVVSVTATASSAVTGNQSVDLSVSGTDITIDDYSLSSPVITILDGQTSGSVTFTVIDDALIENTEMAILTISNPSAGITLGATTTQSITISDNDTPLPTNPTGTGLATPAAVAAGKSTLLTVAVIPGINPTSTGLAGSCDLSSIGGSAAQALYDDGSNGDATAEDNTFSFLATVNSGTSLGAKNLLCTITDAQSRSGNASISLTVQLAAGSVVISQVYGGGGNAGATYKNDFIELYNRSAFAIDLTGWSVQYASTTGTSWQKTDLTTFILQPGQYYLIQEAAGSGGTVNLPAPDATGTILMSATGAKVALVNNQTLLTGSGCPFAASVMDFVGYGSANCSETSPTPALSNTTAAIRKGGGSVDTDNNLADFAVGVPAPHNSSTNPFGYGAASPSTPFPGTSTLLTAVVIPGYLPTSTGLAVSCDLTAIGGAVSQTLYDNGTNGDKTSGDNTFSYSATVAGNTPTGAKSLACTISDDQARSASLTIGLSIGVILPIGTVNGTVLDTDNGATHVSPYVGQTVTVQGVIYEKTLQAISNSTNTYKGFYLQNKAALADGNPNTSDGLFVFMNTADTIGAYTPQVGDEVIISGSITEYFNMTEMQNPNLAVVQVVRSGVVIDSEIPAVVANPPANLADANRYWERLQGMGVQVPQNSIVLGGRNVFSPADAEIWVARPDSTIAQRLNPYARKAYRDAHILDDNYDPANWDGNGYRILMGSLGIKAAAGDAQALIAPARAYSTLDSAVAGGLNYTFSKYRIEVSAQPTFTEGADPAANNPPTVFDRSIHYTIADYNLENLYDYRDNPFSGCDFTGNSGCPKVDPFLSTVTPPYDYVPASDAAYQARLNDIALEIINDLHSPDILMVQEVENQDICTVTGGALTCGSTENADGKPDVLQELALKIATNGGPAYDAAFDRDSSDLRGISPAYLYRTDRVELLDPTSDPVLGISPAIPGYTSVPYDSDVSNPKTLNAVYTGTGACETSWIFPRAVDVGLFRIYANSIGVGSYRDVYILDNHFKSGPDTCVAHRTEQAKFNAALVAFIQAAKPDARIIVGGDLNVYPRPDDIGLNPDGTLVSDQLGSLYNPSLGLKNLWEVLLGQAPEAAYSYVYLGQAQTLDQMFINQAMFADLTQYRIAHINSDFPAEYPGDVARGTSDHDPNVATFLINDAPTADAGGPYTVNEGSSVTLTASGTDPEGQTLAYTWDLDNNGTFETTGPSVSFAGLDGPSDHTVVVQVTDNGGLTATAQATVDVINVAPTAAFSAPASVNEGGDIAISLTNPADVPADLGSLQYAFDCGSGYGPFNVSNTAACPTADNGTVLVGGKVKDKDGGVSEYSTFVTINNLTPVVGPITAPTSPVKIATAVNTSASFTDPGKLDTHTAIWDWGDGSTSSGTMTESNGSGSVAGSHSYTKPGLYKITLTVTDKDGGSGRSVFETVVVYDPNGGFVTGAGGINSPAGAYIQKPTTKGPAVTAFVVKYLKNASTPFGSFNFVFLPGKLEFTASSFDWLVVNQTSKTAQFQGSGKINGSGNYKFMVWATDAHPDTFRIKIWKPDGTIVYDTGSNLPLFTGAIIITK